ncbi:MAG: hypothetical protein AB1346_00480, partial [Thermodesulfobacteriota bacterium]
MNPVERGTLAIERGDHQEAVNIFRREIGRGRSPAAYIGFGKAHFLLEDYPTARWAFHKALELEPGNEEAVRQLSLVEPKLAGLGAAGASKSRPAWRYRAVKDFLEVHRGEWTRLFLKGINLGLGIPGHFPGEYAIRKGTYLKWFRQISGLGVNAIRVYALHAPLFYEALDEWNRAGKTLYLVQGIWAEPPADDDYSGEAYRSYVLGNLRDAVDAVHGSAVLPPRPGQPDGKYTADASWFTIGYLYGREWEPCSVKRYNESKGRRRAGYRGKFLMIGDGSPFEVELTRVADLLQEYEQERYGSTRPCSVVNWPTLDPLVHPSESATEDEVAIQGQTLRSAVCNENEDMETLDVSKIVTVAGPGFFATYHAYPYYPDFIDNDDPEEKEPYLTYLKKLKSHHGGQPVLVAEFGVPSSRESAHRQRNGWTHGRHGEEEQGTIDVLQMNAVRGAGMAGGVLFSWLDEWFKKNWIFQPYLLPAERKPLWFNLQDPEENYGLLAAYPGYPGKVVTLSGNRSEWEDATVLYGRAGAPRKAEGGGPAGIRGLRARHDEGFLYLLIETEGPVDFRRENYLVGMNSSLPESGERLLPFDTRILSPIGLHFLLHLCGERSSRLLAAQSYDRFLNAPSGKIVPERSEQGAWVQMQIRTNARRISKDGKRYFPAHVYSTSPLRHGSLDGSRGDFHSLSDFFVAGDRIEVRIPWCMLNFTDPSSRTVLWMDGR